MRRGIVASLLAIALGCGALFVRAAGTAPTAPPKESPFVRSTGDRANVVIDDTRRQRIGVRLVRASKGTLGRTVRLSGAVGYDETRLTDINLKLDGWVEDLFVTHVGQSLSRGEPLFSFYSAELLAAQTDLINALNSRDAIAGSQATAPDYQDRLVATPRQRLLLWGVPTDQLEAIEQHRQTRPAVIFRAPVSGVVIEKTVVNGMFVESGATVYRIADLSVVWVEVDVPEQDVAHLRLGAPAGVTAAAWPGETFSGRVVNVDPFVTATTRTLKARVALANPRRLLKPGMFVAVDLSVMPREGVVVPIDAIVDSGTQQWVFVAEGESHFEPRRVRVGERTDGQALVLEGLEEGDEVVAQATFFVDAQSRMRAEIENGVEASQPSSSTSDAVTLAFGMTPTPSRVGENRVEVRVRDASGSAVTDADVRVLLSMPPMPSMNMPAMRAEASLTHRSDGAYLGQAPITMAGRWDITATVRRHGRTVGEHRESVIVRD